MSLPEIVVPVTAVVGTPALAYVAARSLMHAARAVVLLVASVVAMRTGDDKRRAACLSIVDKITRRDIGSPAWPRLRAITRR